MDPITPLTKQELENRGWQMTTVENPTPDPGPTVVQQMRLEFATTKAYRGSEGRSRSLRFKLFGVTEADLPNIRLEFGRFIKTRHTASSALDVEHAPDESYLLAGRKYKCKGFIVPNPKRDVALFLNYTHRMGNAEGSPFNVPKDDIGVLSDPSSSWRKPFQRGTDTVCLIGRTKLQASSVNPNEYVAVDPNPDANIPYTNADPQGTILTLTDFIVPFVALYISADSDKRTFAASHYCGTVTTARIQSGKTTLKAPEPFVSLRFVKCGFRLVNVVTGETSPILEFVPIVTLLNPKAGWGVVASVSYGSYNPKRHLTANRIGL